MNLPDIVMGHTAIAIAREPLELLYGERNPDFIIHHDCTHFATDIVSCIVHHFLSDSTPGNFIPWTRPDKNVRESLIDSELTERNIVELMNAAANSINLYINILEVLDDDGFQEMSNVKETCFRDEMMILSSRIRAGVRENMLAHIFEFCLVVTRLGTVHENFERGLWLARKKIEAVIFDLRNKGKIPNYVWRGIRAWRGDYLFIVRR